MKILDLSGLSSSTVTREIHKVLGHSTLASKGSGPVAKVFSALSFTDVDDHNTSYKVSASIYDNGLGLYFRNLTANRLVLIPSGEISGLSITREAEEVSPARWSLFKLLRAAGIAEDTASKYLMPVEIISEHPAFFTIVTPETLFKLTVEKSRLTRLHEILRKTPYSQIVEYNVKPLKINDPWQK